MTSVVIIADSGAEMARLTATVHGAPGMVLVRHASGRAAVARIVAEHQPMLVVLGEMSPRRLVLERLAVGHQRRNHNVNVGFPLLERVDDAAKNRANRNAFIHLVDRVAHAANAPTVLVACDRRAVFQPRVDKTQHDETSGRRAPVSMRFVERCNLFEKRQMSQFVLRLEHTLLHGTPKHLCS